MLKTFSKLVVAGAVVAAASLGSATTASAAAQTHWVDAYSDHTDLTVEWDSVAAAQDYYNNFAACADVYDEAITFWKVAPADCMHYVATCAQKTNAEHPEHAIKVVFRAWTQECLALGVL